MQESVKQNLTSELLALESQKDSSIPFPVARQTKLYSDKLKTVSPWTDSRSSTTASFLNLIQDTESNKEYYSLSDLKIRTTELLIYLSKRLSASEAQTLGIQPLQRVATSNEVISQTQRLSEPGGMFFETARELPNPLTDEAKRRSAQAQKVRTTLAEKLKPATQTLKQRFDTEGWTLPAVLGISAIIMIFTKNKWLAATITGIFIYTMFKWEVLNLPSVSSLFSAKNLSVK